MEYVDYPDVELVSVGMQWHGMNGDMTFTFEHLADAVAASEDVHIKAPRMKVGHDDPRFNSDLTDDYDPFTYGDGEPTLGVVENLRLTNEGATIVGDFVRVPAWLGNALPSAYPNRSIEGAYLDGGWDVTTPGGKKYSFVLTAVALLGIAMPAVQDLEDLERFLTEGPEGDDVTITPTAAVTGQVTDGEVAKAAVAAGADPAVAKADIDKVRTAFWNDFAQDDHYWWWPRSIYTDPNEIIADDDEGHLYRVEFSSDDEGNVTFGDPVEVRFDYFDIASNEPVAARKGGSPAAVFASRREAGRDETKAASRSEQETNMDNVRERLGLAEDATDEEVNAKLEELKITSDDSAGGGPVAEEVTEEVTEPEPIAASQGEPTIQVDKNVWEETQRQAKEGAAARAEQVNEERERTLDAAVKAGKIAPASKDAWREKLKTTPEATASELDKLPAGLIPVQEKGAAVEVDDAQMTAVMASFGHSTNKEGDR